MAPTRIWRSTVEKPGEIAAWPPRGVSGRNRWPPSADIRRAWSSISNTRSSVGYDGGSSTVPPPKAIDQTRTHVTPPSVDRNSVGHVPVAHPRVRHRHVPHTVPVDRRRRDVGAGLVDCLRRWDGAAAPGVPDR